MTAGDRIAYSVAEAAAALGVSRGTMRLLIARGYLHPWTCGRLVRIRRSDLERLVQTDIPSLWPSDRPFPEARPGYERPEKRGAA